MTQGDMLSVKRFRWYICSQQPHHLFFSLTGDPYNRYGSPSVMKHFERKVYLKGKTFLSVATLR